MKKDIMLPCANLSNPMRSNVCNGHLEDENIRLIIVKLQEPIIRLSLTNLKFYKDDYEGTFYELCQPCMFAIYNQLTSIRNSYNISCEIIAIKDKQGICKGLHIEDKNNSIIIGDNNEVQQ